MDRPQDFTEILEMSYIPASCCGKKESSCELQDAYKKGCVPALEELFKSALTVLGGVALGIAAAEVRDKLVKELNKKRNYLYDNWKT